MADYIRFRDGRSVVQARHIEGVYRDGQPLELEEVCPPFLLDLDGLFETPPGYPHGVFRYWTYLQGPPNEYRLTRRARALPENQYAVEVEQPSSSTNTGSTGMIIIFPAKREYRQELWRQFRKEHGVPRGVFLRAA